MLSLVVVLRLVHIVLGALWVGMMVFTAFFLTPALAEAGPDGGKVTTALQRRGISVIMPLIALGALGSGMWLVQRVWGGMDQLMTTPVGLAFAIGGAAAVVAFVLGIVWMRPVIQRAAALAASLESVQNQEERVAGYDQMARLRARGALLGRVVTLLLVFALAAMSVARYVR